MTDTIKIERILAGQLEVGDRICEDDPGLTLDNMDPEYMEWLHVTAVDRRYADLIAITVADPYLVGPDRTYSGSPDQTLIREVV